jgi:hypothetical protein
MYGRRNNKADQLGVPARSSMEAKMANKEGVQDVHDDENFRYVY